MKRVAISIAVVTDSPEHVTRALETFNRAQNGLVLEGIDVTVYAEPLTDENITEETGT